MPSNLIQSFIAYATMRIAWQHSQDDLPAVVSPKKNIFF